MAEATEMITDTKVEDMAKEKPLLNFEELFKDCKAMDEVMFKEKYGIEKGAGKSILDQLWLAKLSEMESTNGKDFEIYRDYVKGFSKTIKEVEIFEPGYHNGKTFTDADIDKIINDTYKAMEAQSLTIPIKLGHSKEQGVAKSLFGEDTKGLPALGWVKNIKKMGKKIVADLVDIPEKLYDMLGEKMWNNRSIELWEGFISNTGKNLGSVVTGLALLGAEQPAVTSLKALFEGEGEIKVYSSKGEQEMTDEVKDTVVTATSVVEAVVPEVKEEVLTELARNEKLRDFKKQADEGAVAIKALAEFKKQTAIAEDKAFLKELADKGQLLPFQNEQLTAILPAMDNKEVSYFDKEIDEEVKGNSKELFKAFLKSLPNQVQLAEFSKQSKTNRSEDIVALVQDFMAKNPTVSREQAYKTVAKENNIQL